LHTTTRPKNGDRPLHVHDDPPAVSPNVTAGVLLCARRLAEPLGLTMPTASEILTAAAATRTRAYELADGLTKLLPTLVRPVGRPSTERAPAPASALLDVGREALAFLMVHPGCVRRVDERGRYTETWRRFVLGLAERHADVPLADLAGALCMPLGTLEDWLRAPHVDVPEPEHAKTDDDVARDAKLAQFETVLDAWRTWSGDFTAFCEHVRRDLRVELGRTMIAHILFAHGERTPPRRTGRSRDEHALRGAFETFFPGAQWVADGKTVEVVIDGEVLQVNLELVVDAATDAAVGIDVRDEEDSAAIVTAFENGMSTTGEPPLALLVDNRPSNHTPEVNAALGETMRIDATLYRAQNKAHVEGAFGLFAQKSPPLVVETTDSRALARSIALLVATTFFRALNRAPRRDREGRSRVELYAQNVTPEDREAAYTALRERMRKQQLARETRAARVAPDIRALLDDAFARLGLLDPARRVRDAIACYRRDDIVDAIAIFETKKQRESLPEGADARYLLGIVRNLEHVHEADAITLALLHERIAARDRFLAPLLHERDLILARDQEAQLDAIIRRLVEADRELDRRFWLDVLALIAPNQEDARRAFARRSARRNHAAFRLDRRERDRLVRLLLRALWPLE
jgi:hypothetical protein